MSTIYIVKAGKLQLGITESYMEAKEWADRYDSLKTPSAPFAQIIEKIREGSQ